MFNHTRHSVVKHYYALLIKTSLILSVSLSFGLYNLKKHHLWLDEGLSVVFANNRRLIDLFYMVLRRDIHPPLYYLQLHFWMMFGSSDYWLNLNPVMWYVATTLIIYLLLKNIYGEKSALISSLIFAVSPIIVHMAQEVRMYSMITFFTTILFWLIKRHLMGSSTRRYTIISVIVAGIIIYSHAAGFIIVFFMMIFYLELILTGDKYAVRHHLRKFLFISLMLAVLLLPLAARSIIKVADMDSIRGDVNFYAGLERLFLFANGQLEKAIVLTMIMLILIVCFFNTKSREIVLPLVALPLAVGMIAYNHLLLEKTFLFIILGISFSLGIMISEQKAKRFQLLTNALGIFMVVVFGTYSFIQVRNFKQPSDYHEVARILEENDKSIHNIYFLYMEDFYIFNWYFLGKNWGRQIEFLPQIHETDKFKKSALLQRVYEATNHMFYPYYVTKREINIKDKRLILCPDKEKFDYIWRVEPKIEFAWCIYYNYDRSLEFHRDVIASWDYDGLILEEIQKPGIVLR